MKYLRSLRDVVLVIGLDVCDAIGDEYRRRHPRPVVREVLHWTDGTD